MRAGFLLAFVLAAIGVLVIFGEGDQVAGLEPHVFAGIVWSIAVGIPALGWVMASYRGQWTKALEAVAFWMAIVLGLVAGYSYRFELSDFANRISGALVPGWTIVAQGGEVSVVRVGSGSFEIDGRVNEASTRFIVDTGASHVSLMPATAAAAGIRLADLVYDVRVRTASGEKRSARVVLERLTIGSISVRRVEALVSPDGALPANLLGMSFLDRLERYEVRGERLVLRGR